MIVSYEPVEAFPGWERAPTFFQSLITDYGSREILEVGSGANPTLEPEFVRSHGLVYTTSDFSSTELEKANPVFKRLVLDLSSETIDPVLIGKYDFILSRMVGEHVSDGRQFHKNIYEMLRPGGISVHCFSTLWALPFAANRMLPEGLTDRLLRTFAPRHDETKHGKFRAYYSWSRGPTKKMLARFQAMGYEIVSYTGYFGHGYYTNRLPWLHRVERVKTGLLLKHPVPELCSYAMFVLRKPV
jgi:2-polyprenyl-3-methyl-5-hydroxy-6-metoxy-1,4-benzoquinol methylase